LHILFSAVNDTLQAFAKDPQWRLQGQLGFIAVLHTWSQTLMDHFHLHCLIPAGALSFTKDRWIPAKDSFLFKIESLAKAFKHCFLRKLSIAYQSEKLIFPGKTAPLACEKEFQTLLTSLFKVKWIAYAKRPFADPLQVLEYLGRYTHRVAISNNRIISVEKGKVSFTYRDREGNNETRIMTLDAHEFIRRFLLHILPMGFPKIRYFGFLAHKNKGDTIALLRKLIDSKAVLPQKIKETVIEMMLRLTGHDITRCPKCGKGKMKMIRKLARYDVNSC
jgi:hypothetical protein